MTILTKPNTVDVNKTLRDLNRSQQILIQQQMNKITELNQEVRELKRRLELASFAKKSG